MMHKLLGAAMILLGCGGFGFSMAARHRRDVRCLQIFLASLDYLECELEYRLTPLPDLCRKVVRICPGAVGKVYDRLASELEGQAVPTVEPCFRQALLSDGELPPNTRAVMEQLGQTLGAFDLSGQLRGIQSVRESAMRTLKTLSDNQFRRIQNYKTLGICAGAALAILLI